jgi:hypothetical protein
MLHPSTKEQISKLMVEGYDEKEQAPKEKKKQNKIIEEEGFE